MPKVQVTATKGLYQESGNGHVHLRGSAPALTQKFAAATADLGSGSKTYTIAQLLTGIILCDPTAAAAHTLPTNTLIRAGLDDPQTGDCFDFAVINTGTDGADEVITVAAGSGGTLVGFGEVACREGTHDAHSSGSGLFRIRIASATAYVCYRLA